MTNAKISMTMSKKPSDSQSTAVENGSLFREQSPNSHSTPKPHIAAAAAIDELLASEARANMQRARISTREEPIKAKVRFTVPPPVLSQDRYNRRHGKLHSSPWRWSSACQRSFPLARLPICSCGR
jgi:hypothetical protein